eukprot:scaffold94453_cov33-Tisochrysis_lutea.AAC.3
MGRVRNAATQQRCAGHALQWQKWQTRGFQLIRGRGFWPADKPGRCAEAPCKRRLHHIKGLMGFRVDFAACAKRNGCLLREVGTAMRHEGRYSILINGRWRQRHYFLSNGVIHPLVTERLSGPPERF